MPRPLFAVTVLGVVAALLAIGGCPLLLVPDSPTDQNVPPGIGDASIEANLAAGVEGAVDIACVAADADGAVVAVEADFSAIGGDARQALQAGAAGAWTWSGVVTPAEAGTFPVAVTVTDDDGATATATVEVVVAAAPGDDGDGGGGDGDGDGGDPDGANQAPVFGGASLDASLVDIDDQEVTITCNVSDADGSVAWVTVDLRPLDGQYGVHMNEAAEGQWTLTVTVAPASVGIKTLTFVACDDDGDEATTTIATNVTRHPITILRDFAAGGGHAAALRDDGSLLMWGSPDAEVDAPQDGTFLKVAAADYTVVIREDSSLLAWGQDDYGETNPPAGTYKEVAAAVDFAAAIRTDGSLAAWGRDHLNYMNVPAGSDFVKLDALFASAVALRDNGTLAVWGPAEDPMLGYIPPHVVDAPVDDGYVDVAAGGYHCLALKENGTLVAWGHNEEGQCDVPAGTYMDVDAGYLFTAAVRTDGTLAAWGLDQYGEVDELPEGNDFVAVWCGMYYAVAKRADGSLVYWGADGIAPIPDELQ